MPRKSPDTEPKTPPKKRGEKRLSNPTSTGGAGGTYETRVQAVYLFAMFTGGSPSLFPDAEVVELRFQGRIHGYRTEDLVCTLKDPSGALRKALLQVKLTLKAVPSDEPFSESIVAAWYDYQDDTLFKKGCDRLVVVYARDADSSIYFASQLTQIARTSLTGAEFVRKATTEGYSSKQQRSAFASVKSIVAVELGHDPGEDELHDFMRHVWFVNHVLATDETPEVANVFALIKFILGEPWRANPRGVWSELITACQQLNKDAASLSFANLDEQVSPKLAVALARHRASSVSKLKGHSVADASLGVSRDELALATRDDEILIYSGTAIHKTARPVEEVSLSAGRFDSANKFISEQLDAVNDKLKQFRYKDALEGVTALGKDLGPFDEHQKARWYLLRGACRWHLREPEDAAADFLKASELFPDDEKMAAAGVRGLLLRKELVGALAAGKKAHERFPASLTVWGAYANARIVNGESLELTDVPVIHRDEADALQLVAAGRQQAQDSKGAAELSLHSLDCPTVGFYTRCAALVTILEHATSNKVLSTYRLVDPVTKDALRRVVDAFEPHQERLWSVQALAAVSEAASNLGIASLLLGDAQRALKLVLEAQAHGVETPQLLRVELEALQQSGQVPEMLVRGRKNLPLLNEDAIVGLAQAAANLGDVSLVEEAQVAVAKLELNRPDSLEVLKAIRWMAMWNASDRDTVRSEALAADLAKTDSLPLVVAGVRALLKSNPDASSAALVRGEQLVTMTPVPENIVLFADLLFEAKEFVKAAPLYEKVVPPGQVSELHNRLLHCYIKTGNRRKARKLIEGFPEGWVNDDDTRSLAIELGQEVGDWPLLKTLADVQFQHAPQMVSSWLFRFMVGVRGLSASELQDLLADAPLDLQGTIQQTAQLATQELRYGLLDRGMQRMYRLRRLTSNDVESASALLLTFVSIPDLLPNMEEVLPIISHGTHFTVTEADGRPIQITVDPQMVGGLPETDEFRHVDAADVVPFIGKAPGDEVVLEGTFRSRRVLKIQSIGSAYRRLLGLAREQMDSSLKPVPNATSVSIPTTADGTADFSLLHEQLKKQSAHTRESFNRYRTMPITLGGFGRLTGKNPVEIVRGWPANFETPAMFVAGGTVDEREKALAQLKEESTSYVIDAATLTELANLGTLDALKTLTKVYATTDTRDLIKVSLEEAKLSRSSGQAYDEDGQLRFVEFTDADHAREIAQVQEIADALSAYCEVVPSYGPEANTDILSQLERAVSTEEHAVLRLAVEKGLCLLTVDGRLRNVASLMQLPGVWPQVLQIHALEVGQLTQSEYSLATVRAFLRNRTFISLGPQDVLLMCHQGTSWARTGVARFKRYLADPGTEFQSAFRTTLDFVHAAAFSCTYMGALAELLRHVVEGLMRHKDCPADVLDLVETFVRGLLGDGSPNPYSAVKQLQDAEKEAQMRYLAQAMVQGLTWSKEPQQERPVRLEVLMVGRAPWLISTTDDDTTKRSNVRT